MVPVLCVLNLSPTGRNPLEVTQQRFVPFGRAPLHFILSFAHVAPARFRVVSGTFAWQDSDLIRVLGSFFLLCPVSPWHSFTCNALCLPKKNKQKAMVEMWKSRAISFRSLASTRGGGGRFDVKGGRSEFGLGRRLTRSARRSSHVGAGENDQSNHLVACSLRSSPLGSWSSTLENSGTFCVRPILIILTALMGPYWRQFVAQLGTFHVTHRHEEFLMVNIHYFVGADVPFRTSSLRPRIPPRQWTKASPGSTSNSPVWPSACRRQTLLW